MNERNLAASVRARLLNHARKTRQDFNLVLNRYAIERLLYRISVSKYSDNFLLKGALLFDLWFDIPHRPTRDADLLSFGSAEQPHIEGIFKKICSIRAPDGVTFQPDTVKASNIREETSYTGVRVMLLGIIDALHLSLVCCCLSSSAMASRLAWASSSRVRARNCSTISSGLET